MVAPKYFLENRYSFVADLRPILALDVEYEVGSPESEFERSIQIGLAEANAHLHREEFTLALHAYEQLRWRILQTIQPQLPPRIGIVPHWSKPVLEGLVDPLLQHAAHMLNVTPEPRAVLPSNLVNPRPLPPVVINALSQVMDAGLATGWKGEVGVAVGKAETALAAGRFGDAKLELERALASTPNSETALRGALHHDLAVSMQRSGDASSARRSAEEAAKLFEASGAIEARVASLGLLADLQRRTGDEAGATRVRAELEGLATTHGLDVPIMARPLAPATPAAPMAPAASGPRDRFAARAAAPASMRAAAATGAAPVAAVAAPFTTSLLASHHLDEVATAKSLVLYSSVGDRVEVALGQAASTSLEAFYESRVQLEDLSILTGHGFTYTQLVAYLPHLYFFVIPMAIGDCYLAMGDFQRAEDSYLSVLAYPYLNAKAEVPVLWMRLADVQLQWGRHLYTSARTNIAKYAAAKARYERIIRTNRTVDQASPLFAHAALAPMRARVAAIAAAAAPVSLDENPAIIQRVLAALGYLDQIAAGLNYFGLPNDYVPPFTFEHLYNLALHFGNQAQQAEQRYIQFKSQAENEELRREQMAQQAELAQATVQLEQLGLAEAEAGIASANASVSYAEVQRANAVASEADFAGARWELLELSTLEAWANASSVDRDDQVELTISGYSYYNTSDTRRNVVIKELTAQRTLLTHDLEAARLQRATASAGAYKAVAQAQLVQAQARRNIAGKRVEIAQVQQRHAQENLEFMDLKEFGEAMWYELARTARELMRRYLDMATEVAFLMERAYDAETDRGLSIIKFDYGVPGLGDLTGAAALVADVDFFQLDYVRIQTKKAPVKEVISIAAAFPMAFQGLLQQGTCRFETTLEMFDRLYPGQYLRKLRSVEVVFVGLARASGIHGTLRNIGVSAFRRADGSVRTLAYPPDVMPLSAYEVRNDSLVFRVDPKQLRLFENNGVATMWQLELPRSTNDIDYQAIFDVQLVVYYDAFFDATLETTVRAALPGSGAASRALSMRVEAPDELFYLRNQGTAHLVFDATMFPRTQEALVRTAVTLRVAGPAGPGLTLRLHSAALGTTVSFTLDGDGLASSSLAALAPLLGRSVFDDWTLTVTREDNPALVTNDALDLLGIEDASVFVEYTFNYRS
jgi:Tc toxin complex TcA C-terminal TcB-binding domain